MPSIRVTLTYDEAESLLTHSHPCALVKLRARGKLSSALLARRDYVSPLERRSADELAQHVKRTPTT